MNAIYLDGIALSNYRGLTSEITQVGPFQRFNYFVGRNNSGKSTFLNFISRHLHSEVIPRSATSSSKIEDLDKNINMKSNDRPIMGIGVLRSKILNFYAEEYPNLFDQPRSVNSRILNAVLDFYGAGEIIWLKPSNSTKTKYFPLNNKTIPDLSVLTNQFGGSLRQLWSDLTQKQGGNPQLWCAETFALIIDNCIEYIPPVEFIPAIRQISQSGQEFSDWSGKGLIEELVKYQNPNYNEQSKSLKFKAINDFIKSVTDNVSAEIEIPYDRKHIIVHMDNKVLPLHVLGTGIHEVIMIAAACTLLDNQIICIEEPELHLHPLLQRRLIQYLDKKTSNQYFIATHSASIIDATAAAIFHVSNNKGVTEIVPALTSALKFDLCRDLGYRASDIVQTNAIIWVEGPSDRIYIKHWIAAIDNSLREGVDYSIMFYGGRLLSHLSAADNDDIIGAARDLEALIEVRQLNRHLCIVIDSDRKNSKDSVNSTKQRIVAELEEHQGIAWVTEGREIENYITEDSMTKALRNVYRQTFSGRLKTKQFDHVLPFKTIDGGNQEKVDKVAIAKAVCKDAANLKILDLENRMGSLVNFIRHAQNH